MASAFFKLLEIAKERIKPRVAIVLGSPRLAAELAFNLALETTCFQLDCHQSQRLKDELREIGLAVPVVTSADLWDLPEEFSTVLYPAPPRGERELKRDMVEQAFHCLVPGGKLVVLSPVPKDQFFPDVMKKVFKKVSLTTDFKGTVLWATREGDRPKRRHEIRYHVRVPGAESAEFVSRPGVFTYGKLDEGTRAMMEVVEVRPDDKILEIGCGVGAAGILAARKAGPNCSLTLTDSNARAVSLAELNAKHNGIVNSKCLVSADLAEVAQERFDLVLANPPYYADHSITRFFVERAHQLLNRNGRLYLVTRQIEEVEPIVSEWFGSPLILGRRHYAIMVATRR